MSGKYIKLDEGSLSEYEVYEIDLTAYGAKPVAFNVDWVPQGQRKWLLRILNDNFTDAVKQAHAAGIKQVRDQMKEALGL